MDRDAFKLIKGNRDVVDSLEHALDMAKRGKLVGVVICGVAEVGGEPTVGFHWAHKSDLPFAWARLLSAVTDAHQDLARNGLVE